ncbi:MAG: flagellar hook-basal body complex protein [Selenomonadaceae bacterium]|nr:flagellar hook-basal body complex protein [Selenomonadaceae bacterium]
MMRSLFSGVSGLKSHQTRMDVIGNNIANINTVGFKSSRVTFSDMLAQTQTGASSPSDNLGGTNPKQIGLGAAVASVDLIFTDGSPQATGKNTDVALSGNGLFVLKSGNQTYFTRDGAFEFDAEGNYVLPGSGYYVQGWNAVDGSLNTNAPTTNIIVPAGKTMPAAATTAVDFNGNLNSGSPIITAITYTKGTGDETTVLNGGKITAVEFQDAQGNKVDGADSLDDEGVAQAKITYTDYQGNTGKTAVVDAVTYKGSVTVGGEYVSSVNVDGKNVISATLTLSDGTTQKVTTGYYQLAHSIPVTTSASLYDSEGNTHLITLLLDKKNATRDEIAALQKAYPNYETTDKANYDAALEKFNNRWMAYIAPSTGEKDPAVQYTQTEKNGSKTEGYLNRITKEDYETKKTEYNALSEKEKALVINPEEMYYPIYDTSGETTEDHILAYGAAGYIYFNTDGSLNSAETSGSQMLLQYSDGNGSDDTSASIDFSGLTQYSGGSTAFPTADGYAFGVLQSVAVDGAGIITGTYTNGVRRFEAQIAVAQFVNSTGLTKVGTSLFQESNNSGAANVKTVSALGLTVTPAALEMSNVDLSNELSDMIITQRGFQSNSKIITVADEMLETIINMKR